MDHRDTNLDLSATTQGVTTMFSVPVRFLSRGPSRRTTLVAQILTMVVVLVSILSVGGGSAAAQGTKIRHISTTSAIAQGEACFTGYEACSWVNVYIGPGKDAGTTWLCLEISTGWDLYEEGCADVTASFVMDTKQLTSADLSPTSVDLFTRVCEGKACYDVYSRTVTVAANWVATGNRTPIQDMQGDPHGACTDVDMLNGFLNESSVTLSVDGQPVAASGNLQYLDAHQTVRTNCR